MPIDQSMPKLHNAQMTNEILNVQINFWKAGQIDSAVEYLEIKLTNAHIVSISEHSPSTDSTNNPNQEYLQVSMTYQKIQWTDLMAELPLKMTGQ
jgi:type VI secretion system Hcp family effector